MTLNNAHIFFESLVSETSKKSEIKIYEKFIHVLSDLKTRDFSEHEIQSIEIELDLLNLNSEPKNRKRYFKKALYNFEKYLKETHSLTTKGHYTSLGVGLGSCFGVVFGMSILSGFDHSLGMSLGIGLGMMVGLLIGRHLDSQAVTEGRAI